MVDGFHGLRHDAVVGGDHEDRDVGEFGATGTHCGEGFVARGIEERDLARLALKVDGHLVCADALGDAAGFAFDDVGAADGVEQSGLTVVDMAHDGDDRRTRLQILVLLQFLFVQVDVELLQQLLVFLFGGHDLDVPADFLAEDLERGSSRDWVAVAISPRWNSTVTSAAGLTLIFSARSARDAP